ncbi:yeats family-domain-containing protein [Lineolata rhizophorae]|uniref:Protein AF-9 homolog n=1 Tax=Lineolata rhizophorae TaxID=578093 RepID=A0A6A6NQQ2_9PEZI|nr:yeats family-domain-containing protein [Lineolata rhizophorae]
MPAPAGTKRVKGKRISRAFIIGSEAWPLPPVGSPQRPANVPDDHTTQWRVYVRGMPGQPDLTTWLKKVQFKLFHTYMNPLRTVDNAPFVVSETGWGGFNVEIRLHFNPASGEKPQWRQHFLQLERYGSDEDRARQEREGVVRSEFVEWIEFNEPTEAFWDEMTADSQWAYLDADKTAAGPSGAKGSGGRGKGATSTTGTSLGGGTAGVKDGKVNVGSGTPAGGPVGVDGIERTSELPDKPTDYNDISLAMEADVMAIIRQAEAEIDKQMAKELERKKKMDEELKKLKEDGATVPVVEKTPATATSERRRR